MIGTMYGCVVYEVFRCVKSFSRQHGAVFGVSAHCQQMGDSELSKGKRKRPGGASTIEQPFYFDERRNVYKIVSEGWAWSSKKIPFGPEGWVDLGDGGRIGYFPRKFVDCDRLFAELKSEAKWERNKIKLFGREVEQPRLICYMADTPSLTYTYSRATLQPRNYLPSVSDIKERLEAFLDERFNCVLLNYYRDGRDYVGWHSDAESVFGKDLAIGSVSLGEPRAFDLRKKEDTQIRWRYMLGNGDVLVMKGSAVQRNWKHSILPNRQIQSGRINLTFRTILYPEKSEQSAKNKEQKA